MTRKIPGTGRGLPRMHGTPGEGVIPGGIQSDLPDSGSDRVFLGHPGDEIAKTGADCLRETPDCLPIAGLAGLSCSKKGPNGPNWKGDNSPHGHLDEGLAERGYGGPVRNTLTMVTMKIGTPARPRISRDSPTWKPRSYPVRPWPQVPDSALPGDEIAKTGVDCLRETPDCPPIAGFVGLPCSKKGPNRPNWEDDRSPPGLLDAKTGKPGSGDPGRNTPEFTGTGCEQEENMKDRTGRYPR